MEETTSKEDLIEMKSKLVSAFEYANSRIDSDWSEKEEKNVCNSGYGTVCRLYFKDRL